ncbi:hypothetical protein KJ644_02980 [Candidatus Dependentiae bacterium]|nr:hypothetical protein [Candidatus Dependentiae bacterium]
MVSLFLILSLNITCNAMNTDSITVQMPNEEELITLFYEYDLEDFAEKTDIINNLIGKKTPACIEIAIGLALIEYSGDQTEVIENINSLISNILEKYPEAKKTWDELRNSENSSNL